MKKNLEQEKKNIIKLNERIKSGEIINNLLFSMEHWCDGSKADNPAQEIDEDIATDYIWDYADTFRALSTNKGAYTQIKDDDLAFFSSPTPMGAGPDRCGLLVYFCEINAKFYFAIRLANSIRSTDIPIPVREEELAGFILESKCHTVFTSNEAASKGDIITHLQTSANTCRDACTIIIGTAVNEAADKFKTTINGVIANAADMPYGFFHYNQVRKVLTQSGCNGLRFYWGYDKVAKKIKLIVFGIDGDGKNITGAGAKILERHWPPDVGF